MKNLIFAASVLLLFAACGSDSSQTELAIKNSDQTGQPIKDIVWADYDADWGEEIVDSNSVSSSKEVNETTGQITCSVYDGDDYNVATVISEQTGTEAVTIDEGSSNVVTIKAVP